MSFELLELLPPLLLGGLYLKRSRTLSADGRPLATWRVVCFVVGLLALTPAVLGPVQALAGDLLIAHMIEHLLIGDIATLLLVLGMSGPLLAPVLRAPLLGRLRVLGNPAIAFPLWAADLYVWHIPFLHEAAVQHPLVHVVQHAMFIGFGIAMWMPLFGPLPRPVWFGTFPKLAYIVAVRLTGALHGTVLTWSGTVYYDVYAAGERHYGIGALQDQGTAGLVMMVEGSILTLLLFAWLFLDAARQGDERQRLLDLAAANGVELTDERAARAVAAGRGAELEQRLIGAAAK